MTVYVVHEYADIETTNFIGVYSTPERAEEAIQYDIDTHTPGWHDRKNYDIQPVTVDEMG